MLHQTQAAVNITLNDTINCERATGYSTHPFTEEQKAVPSSFFTVNNTQSPAGPKCITSLSHTYAHTSRNRLPGRPWNRCPSSTGDWLAPHRRHLGILRAAVQVRELLQLGLSDLIIVILHTERGITFARAHTHTHGNRLAFNYTVLNYVLYLQGYSPGNI